MAASDAHVSNVSPAKIRWSRPVCRTFATKASSSHALTIGLSWMSRLPSAACGSGIGVPACCRGPVVVATMGQAQHLCGLRQSHDVVLELGHLEVPDAG